MFFPCYEIFFPPLWNFCSLLFHWSKSSNFQPALDAWKHMIFVYVFKKIFIIFKQTKMSFMLKRLKKLTKVKRNIFNYQ